MMCQVFMLKVHNVFLNKLKEKSLCVIYIQRERERESHLFYLFLYLH